MRLDRLLGITLELMAKQRVTAAELSAKFEVSVRTVYRDIELINQAGIPVASFTGADGGFELMSGFFLTRQHFSVDDLSVIYSLLKAMEDTMGGTVTAAMRKLTSLHPALANEDKHTSLLLNLTAPVNERTHVQLLFQAIRQSRLVVLAYSDSSGTMSERTVEPINLLWEKGIWYLEGYCRLRRGKRYFRISRILRIEMTESVVTPRKKPDAPEQDSEQGVQVHLRFDPSVRQRVFEQFPGECRYEGDRIEVETTFYKQEYALSVIVSYGTKVDIVSPDIMREEVIDHLEAIRQHYLNS